MNNTKVYHLIQATPLSDRVKISHILQSSRKGKVTLISRLYDTIHHHSQVPDRNLDREHLWRSLHPDKPFRDSTLRKLCADLVKEIESAFGILFLEENDETAMLHYLQYLRDRNFDSAFFKKEVNKIKRKREKSEMITSQEYYENFKIEELEYQHKNLPGSAWTKSNIERIDQSLNSFFILEKLRLALSIFSRQKYIRFEKELPFLEVILQVIEEGTFDEEPLVLLYYYAVKTYQDTPEETMYFNLKTGLQKHLDIVHSERMRELMTIALSYCIGKVNQNQPAFYREALDWYKLMISKKILIEQDHLAATTFRNIVLLAIRLDEYDWATEFVEEYTGSLKPDLQESTRMLSMGQILFNKREYNEVIDYLRNVDYINVSYNLQSKLILAATYFELEEYEVLMSFLHTFSTYLRRKKKDLSREKYHRHQKFISALNQMLRTPAGEKEKWKEIADKLQKDPEVVSYNWLMDKTKARTG